MSSSRSNSNPPSNNGDNQPNFGKKESDNNDYTDPGDGAYEEDSEEDEQLRKLGPILKESWRVEENKYGNTTYENPSVMVIYRKDYEYALDQIIPTIESSFNEFDLVMVSQAYRSRATVEKNCLLYTSDAADE